ncbi:MAG: hypothetical protein ACXAEF_01260 [Candidatus Thorarchaeota archaeon]
MPQNDEYQWVNWLVASLFFVTLVFLLYMSLSGIAWEILSIEVFTFWMILITFLVAVSAGGVGTYSFVSFVKNHEMRSLMLILLGANFVLWIFLFLVTHPGSAEWSTFSDRERNRTLVMTFVLLFVPCILLGSFSGKVKLSRPSTRLLILWGAIAMPFVNLLLFLSPDPLFAITSSEGGVEGLTLIGIVLSLGYLISHIVAVARFALLWFRTRDTLDFALFLALSHWISGTLFGIILWDPLQVAELLWIFTILSGFFLVAAMQFITSILQPHKELEDLVEQRTREVEVSNKESEYYLKMWTHKMGNILQGMVTYLDVLEHAAQGSEDDTDSRSAARVLSREAILVNHQVIQLTQIKESLAHELKAIDASEAIRNAIDSGINLLGDESFTVDFTSDAQIHVKCDDLLELVILSAIKYYVKNKIDDRPTLKIAISQTDTSVSISMTSRGKPLSSAIQNYLQGKDLIGSESLDLNLFTIKVLMQRYQGRIHCFREDSTEEATCTFELQAP